MKKNLKKMIPKSFINEARKLYYKKKLISISIFDYKRYKKSAFIFTKKKTFINIKSQIIMNYHALEKGLSYTEFRKGFGKTALNNLFKLLDEYKSEGFPTNDEQYLAAVSTLDAYVKYHESLNYNVEELKIRINNLKINTNDYGGVEKVKKEKVIDLSKSNFDDLTKSRVSSRNFSSEKVDKNIIREAIEIAMRTPSSCNRQPWKVYIVNNEESKKVIQSNQKGNKGFGHKVDTFLIVTTNSEFYSDEAERNAPYVDGGLFAMSLLYSLHFKGLANCALNASMGIKEETNIRNHFNINSSENLVLFIAVGNFQEEFKVAKSKSKKTEEIIEHK